MSAGTYLGIMIALFVIGGLCFMISDLDDSLGCLVAIIGIVFWAALTIVLFAGYLPVQRADNKRQAKKDHALKIKVKKQLIAEFPDLHIKYVAFSDHKPYSVVYFADRKHNSVVCEANLVKLNKTYSISAWRVEQVCQRPLKAALDAR